MKDKTDIYLIGVGGQGIGLLSEALIRAADYANLPVRGVDTHGLAQRGGTVESHLRIGDGIHSALIQKGEADMVIALERNEALRGLSTYLKENGDLIYYNTSWQPLDVRLEKDKDVTPERIEKASYDKDIEVIKVFKEDLEDTRMQNVVILGQIASENLLTEIKDDHYRKALKDLLKGEVLQKNLDLFNSLVD